jgi:hypothetical protein
MDSSSRAMEIADVNITGLTPQQPSALASCYENSHTYSTWMAWVLIMLCVMIQFAL